MHSNRENADATGLLSCWKLGREFRVTHRTGEIPWKAVPGKPFPDTIGRTHPSRFPTIPWENNHYSNSGNPPLGSFSCEIIAGEGETESLALPSCEVIDIVTENIKGGFPEHPRILSDALGQ